MKSFLASSTSLLIILIFTLTSCTAKYKKEEQALSAQLDDCIRQLEAEKKTETGLKKQIADLTQQLASGNAKETGLQQQIANLKARSDADKAKETGLKKQIADMTQQLASEKAKENGIQRQLDAINAQIAAQKEKAEREAKNNDAAYQQLLNSLKDEIQKDEISIQQYKDVLVINVAERVLFDLGRAEIKPQYYPILDKIGTILKEQTGKFIQIEGHTDDIPIAAEYQWKIPNNWALGGRRAINVTIYLTDHFNIDPHMIGVMSFSKYRPLVPNTSKANRAKNRRIEIILLGQGLYQQLYKKGM